MKEDDGLGDWRLYAVTRLAEDIPAAFPGGPSHKAGTPVYQTHLVKNKDGENVSFLLPHATAMALNISISASQKATELSQEIEYQEVLTPDGPGKCVANEKSSVLFDYFEQCMISVTFSFQALEVFSNHTIFHELKQPMKLQRKNELIEFKPWEIERQASTEEKLAIILPKIKNLDSPKGKKVWQDFKVLKEARDSTIHFKTENLLSSETKMGQPLFYHFLNEKPIIYPKSCEAMIKYFSGDCSPRWLKFVKIA